MHPLNNLKLEDCDPILYKVIGPIRSALQGMDVHIIDDAVLKKDKKIRPLATKDALRETSDSFVIQEDGSLPGEPDLDFYLEENEDPLGRLGYGVMSYFHLITTFLVIFFLLACVHIPMMYEY